MLASKVSASMSFFYFAIPPCQEQVPEPTEGESHPSLHIEPIGGQYGEEGYDQ